MYLRWVFALLVSVILLSAPVAAQDGRLALVIGNGGYAGASRLENPTRDATSVAEALRDVGFAVQIESDLNYEKMRRVLRDFANKAEGAEWALVYYAGHGIEVGGTNYLIPVDARLKSDTDVDFEAMPLEQVLKSVGRAKRLRLVILDACRENPFLQQMTRTLSSRSLAQGLARVEPEGGTLVAYAAKAGQIAFDGAGKNSPFAAALVKHLKTPGVEIRRFFGLVRDDVLAMTAKKQEPFVYGSIGGDEYFFRKVVLSPEQTMTRRQPEAAAAAEDKGSRSLCTGTEAECPLPVIDQRADEPQGAPPSPAITKRAPVPNGSPVQLPPAQRATRLRVPTQKREARPAPALREPLPARTGPRPRDSAKREPSRECFNVGASTYCE